MRAHVNSIKKKIDDNIIHKHGSVAAPPGGTGQFPFGGPLIVPACFPTPQKGAGA